MRMKKNVKAILKYSTKKNDGCADGKNVESVLLVFLLKWVEFFVKLLISTLEGGLQSKLGQNKTGRFGNTHFCPFNINNNLTLWL